MGRPAGAAGGTETAGMTTIPKSCDLCHDTNGAPEELFLHGVCHLTAPLQASLIGTELILRCYVPDCGHEVARFTVKESS